MSISKLQVLRGSEGLIFHELLAKHKQIVYIIAHNSLIDEVCDLLKFFNPATTVIKIPSYDVKPYERISPSTKIQNQRLKALSQLVNRYSEPYILVTTEENLLQLLPPKKVIAKNCFEIKVNEKIERDFLLEYFIECGFVRMINAFYPGEFSVRGSIIDIVLTEGDIGYRIDFFGDTIESIRSFNIATQVSIEKVDNLHFVPTSEIIITPHSKDIFTANAHTRFGLKAGQLIESVESDRKIAGGENLLPLFYDKLENLFDFISVDAFFLVPDNLSVLLAEFDQDINSRYEQRQKFSALNKDELASIVSDPKERYLKPSDVINQVTEYAHKHYNIFNQGDNRFKIIQNFFVQSKTLHRGAFDLLKEFISNNLSKKILIFCFSQGSKERLKHMLKDHELLYEDIENFSEVSKKPAGIALLVIAPLSQGFISEDIMFISEQDLLGERLVRKSKVSKTSKDVFNEIAGINPGELIVHLEHGIGKFGGIESLEIGNIVRDFIKITYADNDKLYVPVENFDIISKYGSGEDVALDKLGGAAWQLRKSRLRNKIKLAAEALLKIAAERSLATQQPVAAIAGAYEEFISRFPYVETEDQERAIADVIEDFSSGKPMDRLICGDVGYGKTEVALRATFIALACENPMQVAVLVPTTLLSRQHFKTFIQRFDGIPIILKQLSKFTARTDIKQIKKALEEGKVDIVIGTHALLAKDIKFKNLGLIIIDEEQHFGVAQKERLKELKVHSHVLTLSATPIPRTLQMSLSGIKDLSIIATPPVDRIPIKTYVMPYDGLTVREAILREHYRGGRIFYVTPRISHLDSIVEKLKEIVPEIKVVKAHGQMKAHELDKIMNDFYDGKYEVLVSTTIVESGLDIPFANTIIIDRADMFGLAQLYQIRGRIGRSNAQAYAYLTYPQHLKLSDIAEKRLSILQSLDSLGAGFSIASHDMDMRGYGNLVGDEQSGHIKEVGIELYQHMLEEAINSIRANTTQGLTADNWSPILNIGISIQIPQSYISESALRLSLYRRIAAVEDIEGLEALASEMIDRFGALPTEAEHLISIVKLKSLAKKAYVEKIDLGERGIVITFKNNVPACPDKIIELMSNNPHEVKLKPDQKLLILRTWTNPENIIKGIEKILLILSGN